MPKNNQIDHEDQKAGDPLYKKYLPWITISYSVLSIILFIGINTEQKPFSIESYNTWGYYSAVQIFIGKYWGLISSNFLHTELWHIGFNLYWIWIIGKRIEWSSSKWFYIFLVTSSALISSCTELSFSGETGIGLSGIGYALFGYVFIKSKTTGEYKDFLTKGITYMFFIWLLLCIFLTQLNIWHIGNAAHIGGMLWGFLVAWGSRYKTDLRIALYSLGIILLGTSVFWNPLSSISLSLKAYKLHKDGNTDAALDVYNEIMRKFPDNEFAKANIDLINLQCLQDKAYELHNSGKYGEARKVYEKILLLDPENEWAQINLKRLPEK